MRLESVTVSGFRSLAKVGPIPLGSPTILTGHNDGGKSATLDAILFLLGKYTLRNDDRTFSSPTQARQDDEDCEAGEDSLDVSRSRVTETRVQGSFLLDISEQAKLSLPDVVQIRRISVDGKQGKLEILQRVPENPELRSFLGTKVADLKDLADRLQVERDKNPTNRDGWVELLKGFAEGSEHVDAWIPASSDVVQRLPIPLRFGGEQASVDATVKTILNARYKTHLEEPGLRQRVRQLEEDLRSKLREDAADLCQHIKERCPDLVQVEVLPEVSFSGGFTSAHLRLARTDGEPVAVGAAGAGRERRIGLAVWEWANEVLRTQKASKAIPCEAESQDPKELSEVDDMKSDVVILYDEPDTHLDYSHQRRVMKLIREQCELPHLRMMIATHSMNLIDGVDISSIVHLTLQGERTVMERLADESGHEDVDRHLAHIATALGLRNSVLLHERLFVGVEGPTEQQSLPVLFRLYAGVPLQSAGIALWACNNNEGALMFAKFLASHNRRVALVIDADSREKQKIFSDDKIRSYGLDPDRDRFMIGGDDKELEYLFSDEQWATTANAKWQRVDGVEWTPEMIAGKRLEKKFSDALLEEFKESSADGPQRKAEMVYGLVEMLRLPHEVPEELGKVFSSLVDLANPEP